MRSIILARMIEFLQRNVCAGDKNDDAGMVTPHTNIATASIGSPSGSVLRAGTRRRLVRIIDVIFQFLAGFEVGNPLGRHFHLCARLRIAARAAAPLPRAEAPESANLDFVIRLQRAVLSQN